MSSTMEPWPVAGDAVKIELAPAANSDYCRLCAAQFPTFELRNFSASNEESNRLLVAIHRMNPSIQRGDELPQKACKECIRLLEAVEVIAKKIANAQSTLADIFKRVLASKPFEIKMELKMESTCASDSENEKSSDSQPTTEQPTLNAEMISDSFIDDSESEPTSDSLTTDTEEECENKKNPAKIKQQTKMKIQSKRQVQNTTTLPMNKNLPSAIHSAPMKAVTVLRSNESAMLPSYNNDPTRTKNEALVKSKDLKIPCWINSESEPTSDNLTTDTGDEYEKKKKPAKSKKQIKPNNTVKVQRKRLVQNTATSRLYNNLPTSIQSIELEIETASHSSKLSMLPIYNNVPTTTVNNEAPVKSEDPTLPRWSDFFCCRRCNHRAQSLQDLRKHSWSTHKLCIVFNCVKCSGPGINLKKYLRHMRLKHYSALEKCCEFCNQCFVSSSEVRFHKELEHTDEAKPHKCKTCGSTFDLAEELQSHRDLFIIVKARNAGDRRFKCAVCDKVFLNKITLQSHLIDEHDPTKKLCSICDKKFKSKYNLKHHIEVVHDKIVGKHICHICGKEFHTLSALKIHIFTHAGILNYSCGICNKKFSNNSYLKQHQVTHTGARPHVCSVCDKSFKFHNGLKLHMRTHSGVKPYSCEMCDKSFTSWSNYNKHMKRIHQRDMSKRKRFKNLNRSDLAKPSLLNVKV